MTYPRLVLYGLHCTLFGAAVTLTILGHHRTSIVVLIAAAGCSITDDVLDWKKPR